ncbi:metal-nicotianamine transporter YSL3-like protein [Tanacetum coccineum]
MFPDSNDYFLVAMSGKHDGVIAGPYGSFDFDFTKVYAMLVSQAIGTGIGFVVAPLTFFLFYKAFDIEIGCEVNINTALCTVYGNMAILGVQKVFLSALPNHCLQLCYLFFGFALVANLVRGIFPHKIGRYLPLPMAMAVPFLVGAYFAIDMCVGSLIVFVWHKLNKQKASPGSGCCFRFDMWRWVIDSSIINSCLSWDQSSDLHELCALNMI